MREETDKRKERNLRYPPRISPVMQPTFVAPKTEKRAELSAERKDYSLSIMSRQTRMAARAPMLSLRVCPSWIRSQCSPQKPGGQMQRYRSLGSWLMHVPPCRQGLSRHSFLSTQPFRSGDCTRPSPQLHPGIQQHARFKPQRRTQKFSSSSSLMVTFARGRRSEPLLLRTLDRENQIKP